MRGAAQKSAFAKDTKWVTDVLHVGGGKGALRYLARYVRRSALGDRRLLGYNRDGKVLASWASNDTGKRGILTLHPHELIRRWLRHVLPRGFTRLRHYGFMAGAARETRLRVRALLGEFGEPAPDIPGRDPFTCEHCGGELVLAGKIEPVRKRGPPAWKHIPEREGVAHDEQNHRDVPEKVRSKALGTCAPTRRRNTARAPGSTPRVQISPIRERGHPGGYREQT